MQKQEFKTINDIAKRRAKVRILADIQKDEIGNMWHNLTHKEEEPPQTTLQKVLSYADKATIAFDGAMLGWKLYKKLKSIKK